jgi:DNA invertase Pin-like site-specific DNA recombinase
LAKNNNYLPGKKRPGNEPGGFSRGDRVVGYFRDSGGKDQDRSVEEQKAEWLKGCNERGLIAARQFEDVARTARTTRNRREFLEMIEYFETGQATDEGVKGLFLWSYNRFARDEVDAQYFISAIRRAGYQVQSLTDQVPEGDFGRIMEAFIFFKDAQFSRDLSKHVQRGQAHLLANYRSDGELYELPDGDRVQLTGGGFPPIGYERHQVQTGQNRRGTPRFNSYWKKTSNADLARRVRLAWQMGLDGYSYQEIENQCRLRLNKASYNDFFATETYMGIYNYGAFRREDAFEPYVTREEFERVQEMTRKRKYGQPPRKPGAYRYLLSGMLSCVECGRSWKAEKLTPKSTPSHYWYYECSSKHVLDPTKKGDCYFARIRLRAERLESAVLTAAADLLAPDLVEHLVHKLHDQRSQEQLGYAVKLQALNDRLDSQTKEIQKLAAQLPTAQELGIEDDLKALIIAARSKRDVTRLELENLRIANQALEENLSPDYRKIALARSLMLEIANQPLPSGYLLAEDDERVIKLRVLLEDIQLKVMVGAMPPKRGRREIYAELKLDVLAIGTENKKLLPMNQVTASSYVLSEVRVRVDKRRT